MTPLRLVMLILGVAFGHLSCLKAYQYIPYLKLIAAETLLADDLEQVKNKTDVDKDKALLLCLRQLEDWQDRAMAARELLGQESLLASDISNEKAPKR